MDIIEILDAHGVAAERIDGVPYTWNDVIDRLLVDLKALGWRGELRSIAAHNGRLGVEIGGAVSAQMAARIARAADEARHVCEECGTEAVVGSEGRALCSRCATLDRAVSAALEAAPDDETLGALVYELYCAWELRRRIASFDEGRARTYSSDEVFDELRRWSIEGPERAPAEPSGLETIDRRSLSRARLRRERIWEQALASKTGSITLTGVRWETFQTLRREAKPTRATCHNATLELREPGAAHEMAVNALAEAIELAVRTSGKQLEVVRAPVLVDERLRVAAAPDLAVGLVGTTGPAEVIVDVGFDGTAPWRAEVYAVLRIPEVWQVDAEAVEILLLDGERYIAAVASAAFPPLRRLTLRHIVEAAVLGDLADARRYTERVLASP